MWYVNENFDERYPGDLMAFDTDAQMLFYFEYWFAAEPHLIFNEIGEVFKFKCVKRHLEIERRPDLDFDDSELQRFFAYIEHYGIKPEPEPVGCGGFFSELFSKLFRI